MHLVVYIFVNYYFIHLFLMNPFIINRFLLRVKKGSCSEIHFLITKFIQERYGNI